MVKYFIAVKIECINRSDFLEYQNPQLHSTIEMSVECVFFLYN